jgi:Tol biopolymer transport system component
MFPPRRLAITSAALSLLFALADSQATAQSIRRITVQPNGLQSMNGDAWGGGLGRDGRFVVFTSQASDLTPGRANGLRNVFVRDLATEGLSIASVTTDGRVADGSSGEGGASISRDGRYVAFTSRATNLLEPGWPAGGVNVFVHDRESGETSLESISIYGHPGRGWSDLSRLSDDGRYLLFRSLADNLVRGPEGVSEDVFLRDRSTRTTEQISVSSTGLFGNGDSAPGAVSADGRWVVFSSDSTNLVSGDTNRMIDVFLRDRLAGTTVRLSVDFDGTETDQASTAVDISPDGRYVAIDSYATHLLPEPATSPQAYVLDRETGIFDRVSVNDAGEQANRYTSAAAMTADGRYVVLSSYADNLAPNDTNGSYDVFLRDRLDGTTTLISRAQDGSFPNGWSLPLAPGISDDGRRIVFSSRATDLVDGDTNRTSDVFVWDRRRLVLDSVSPSDGSDRGGDWITLDGSFDVPESSLTVRFGGRSALVGYRTSHRLQVRTPPGEGAVDVSVGTDVDISTRTRAFTYVPAEFAARWGNVGIADGRREISILANGLAGDPLRRELSLAAGDPLSIVVVAAPSRQTSRFAIYAWVSTPSAATLVDLPRGLGTLVLAPPFVAGDLQPRVVWNNAGRDRLLGTPTRASRPAPSYLLRRANGIGARARTTVTLQGLLEDDASQVPEGWSVTNALVLHVE